MRVSIQPGGGPVAGSAENRNRKERFRHSPTV